MRQNRSPSLLVHITSFKCTFIHVSQLTRWPLYVSPFLSSTSCDSVVERDEKKNVSVCQQAPRREKSQIFVDVGRSIRARSTRVSGGARAMSTPAGTRDARAGLRETKLSARRTIGWPWDVFSSERGSISRGGGFGLRNAGDHAAAGESVSDR